MRSSADRLPAFFMTENLHINCLKRIFQHQPPPMTCMVYHMVSSSHVVVFADRLDMLHAVSQCLLCLPSYSCSISIPALRALSFLFPISYFNRTTLNGIVMYWYLPNGQENVIKYDEFSSSFRL